MDSHRYSLNNLTVHIHFVLNKVTYPGWEDIRNLVNVHSLYWIHEGEGVFITNIEHEVKAGMLVYLKPGLHLSMRAKANAPLRMTMLLFDCAELSYEAVWKGFVQIEDLKLPFLSYFSERKAETLGDSFYDIYKNWMPGMNDGAVVSQAKLLILLFNLHQTIQADWNLIGSGAMAAFEQIKSKLENSYMTHHRITKLANEYGISASHLRKLFLRNTSMGPKEYHMHIQNQHACRYLVFTNYTIKEIAKLCGYYEEYHFSKIFKKLNGIPPTIYRSRNREET
ncbi:AraC family transcriptional regulator [Paenibacillus camerounensis]|uniref:AraC family transcriptional regulator n=1 Tax=Paenibacillus camerounensis TaxID=1243663 RepID=UPI000693ACF8|nr:AraC family transcriptional regulator [Paenibacillus camerounensis]